MSDSRHGGGQVRVTRQRRAVSSALDDTDGFRSAQQIHELLRSRGDKVGLTTVYRTLRRWRRPTRSTCFAPMTASAVPAVQLGGHHHHLVCRSCGLTAEVEGPTVENWADRVAAVHGFSDVSHTLEIFGLCGGCSRTYE
jgi:Fur family ferric uptake transcriptional regulator